MTTTVQFRLPAESLAGADAAILLGEFNNWNPQAAVDMQRQDDGSMIAELPLEAGKTYEYRYLLSDGRWVNDNNEKKSSDIFGASVENCIIAVAVPETIKRSTAPKAKSVKVKKETASDDLSKIEGINKKVETLLNKENIRTYRDLSKLSIKRLQVMLDGAGSKFIIYNPATWPKQAKLASAGKWEELRTWQEELKQLK